MVERRLEHRDPLLVHEAGRAEVASGIGEARANEPFAVPVGLRGRGHLEQGLPELWLAGLKLCLAQADQELPVLTEVDGHGPARLDRALEPVERFVRSQLLERRPPGV